MSVNSAQIAWAAGVIEGEGSIQVHVRCRRGAAGEELISVIVRVVMSDEDVVTALRETFGLGRVNPYHPTTGLGTKPLYRWDVSSRADVAQVCDLIYDWMGTRRRAQIDHLREMVRSHPPVSQDERMRRTWAARRANAVAA